MGRRNNRRIIGTGMRIYLLAIALSSCLLSFSQGLKVKEFKQNVNDGSAFHAPSDAEGHPCGLIKVRTNNSELQFKGNIVGDVENKMNEYWVYVTQGSTSIKVCHPNFIPFIVPFVDYGIVISSKATYVLTLEETKYKKEKTGVTIIAKPEDADLYIDDVFIDNLSGNGFYQMYLPKGDHVCRLSKAGYRPNVQIVQTGKAAQDINVELESVMAELEVTCKTATAEIFIDGELKGNGVWKGAILAGEHKIEARQQNYNSQMQTIILAEEESKAVVVPELKRSMGKLRIETDPSNLPIIVDGKSIGISPCTIDVESGKHYVTCNTFGCNSYRSDVEVISGEMVSLKARMQYDTNNFLHDYYVKAYNGNKESIKELAQTIIGWIYRGSSQNPVVNSKEAIYWLEQCEHPEEILDNEGWIDAYCFVGNPEKALQLYMPIKKIVENRGGLFLSENYMSRIGDAFLKKKEIDKAITCFEKADKDGYEGLGDCYVAKGDKQRAATYYRRCLNSDFYNGKNRVEKKLKNLGY